MKRRQVLLMIMGLLATTALAGCFASNQPHAAFTATPDSGFPPLQVSFDAAASSSPNGAVVSYNWDFGDGTEGSGETATHTYEEKGSYQVTLIITDSNGDVGARSKTIEALNRVPVAQFSASGYTVGVDQPIRFDASESYDTDGEIVEYIWDLDDGTAETGVVVEHRYMSAGNAGWRPHVRLTVVDEDGGESSVTRQIIVVGCESCSGWWPAAVSTASRLERRHSRFSWVLSTRPHQLAPKRKG